MGILDRFFKRKKQGGTRHPDPIMEAAMRAHAEPVLREWAKSAEQGKTKRGKPDPKELEKAKDVEGLVKLLRDDDEDIQFKAARSLGEIGDIRAVEPLIEALNAKSSSVRWRVALSLGEIKDARVIKPLIVATTDQNPQVRWRAAEALGRLGELHYLEQLLGEGSERDRVDIADSMISIGGIEAVPSLVRALQDRNRYKPAAWAIAYPLRDLIDGGHVDEKRLHELLGPAIQHFIGIIENAKISKGARSFDEYAALAISALGAIGDSCAIPPLDGLLAKIREKVAGEGIVREYVNTGIAAGYISTQSDISHIEQAIENIRKRAQT